MLVHAVSVGEVNAIREFVPLLGERAEVVVAASTDTGLARARELFAEAHLVVRYPLDASGAVRRFLDAVRPNAVALVELELWPNFVRECVRRGIPIGVVNGRLSDRSFRGYRRIRPFIGGSFRALAFAGVQDETYAERFRAMGTPADRVHVTGSMKFDSARVGEPDGADDLARALGIDRARPLIVAGSTGPGEEALIRTACERAFHGEHVQLLCAPRKPERFDEAAAALPGCVRRSRPGAPAGDAPRWFLLDTIGELRSAYALADLVVVGRSFFDLYGSDPLEPAALGKPMLIGPRVDDFRAIVEALDHAGAIVRTDRDRLGADLAALLDNAERRADLGRRALACVEANLGASRRNAGLVAAAVGV